MENKKNATQIKHEEILDELQNLYLQTPEIYRETRRKAVGIRSSQISALIALLIKKGVLK